MKYEKHQVIEVHHQYGVKTWECESFWDAAINNGELDHIEYHDMQSAIDMWGSEAEVPAELAELLKNGPAFEVSVGDNPPQYYAADAEYDKEAFALEVLAEDLNRIIVIDSEEEAQHIAETYKDHEWVKVRAAARQIMEEQRRWA